MADKTWKNCEREIAKFFPGSKRRGADFRNHEQGGGKSDLVGVDGMSIEIKHSARPTFGLMKAVVAQAETNREHPFDVPIAIIHKAGDEYRNSLPCCGFPDVFDVGRDKWDQ